MDGRQTDRIRIIRKGNGLVQVDPSRAILKSRQDFTIVNTTNEDAVLGYDPGAITTRPAGASRILETFAGQIQQTLVAKSLVEIPAHSSRDFTAGAGPLYFEYDVLLLPSGQCAEGGSKPGGIVDP